MDIEVFIEGVSDARVTTEIRRALKQVCRNVYRAGQWSVLVSPAETRGQWDLGVRGPFGHRFVSFTTEADQLPGLVAEQMRACF